MKVIGKEGLFGIIHRHGRALIWPTLDCSIPVLNQRNIEWAENARDPIIVPDGWELEYTKELNISRFKKWVFVVNINAQKSWILRSSFNLNTSYISTLDQFHNKGIKFCLDQIPEIIIKGDGKILLEDSIEWVMEGQKEKIRECVQEIGVDLDRIRFVSALKLDPEDIHFDSFEAQTLFDMYGCGGRKSDYQPKISDPKKMFVCLNRRADEHRAIIRREFDYRGLMDESYFTYTNQSADEYIKIENPITLEYLQRFSASISDLTEQSQLWLPGEQFRQRDGWPRNGFTSFARGIFNDSAYYVVTETHNYRWDQPWIFVTEKTYRSFLYRIPFIMIGNPGLLNYLTGLGYDVDFDGIGMAYNDDPMSVSGRVDNMMEQLDIMETLTKPTMADIERCENNFKILTTRGIARSWMQTLSLIDA